MKAERINVLIRDWIVRNAYLDGYVSNTIWDQVYKIRQQTFGDIQEREVIRLGESK